jgi:hypothetical protein
MNTNESLAQIAQLYLTTANLPVNPTNVGNLVGWFYAESGGNKYDNGTTGNILRDLNPLNMSRYGAIPVTHSWGTVNTYSTIEASAHAFANFMKQDNMANIARALKNSVPVDQFAQALIHSQWDQRKNLDGTFQVDAQGNPISYGGSVSINNHSYSGVIAHNNGQGGSGGGLGVTPTTQNPTAGSSQIAQGSAAAFGNSQWTQPGYTFQDAQAQNPGYDAGVNIGQAKQLLFEITHPHTPQSKEAIQLKGYLEREMGNHLWMLTAGVPGDGNAMGLILVQAALGGWDAATVVSRVQSTAWFKHFGQDWAAAYNLEHSDPASWNHKVQQQTAELQQIAGQLGIQMDPTYLKSLAKTSIYGNWNAQQMEATLRQNYTEYNPAQGKNPGAGSLGDAFQQAKQLAWDNGVSMTDNQLYTLVGQLWSKPGVSNQSIATELQKQFGEIAAKRMPWAAQALQTQTLRQYLQPYAESAQQLIGEDGNSIDWHDPKWTSALIQVDPKSGAQSMASIDQFQRTLKTQDQYGYRFSQDANTRAQQMAAQIATTWGVVK